MSDIFNPSGSVQTGTFANKPASPSAGTQYFATDLGAGIMIVYTGSKWKPVNGYALFYFDTTLRSGAGTGAEANYANILIPAGMVSATGGIRFMATASHTGTTGGKTCIVRHSSTSGNTSSGTQLVNSNFGSGSTSLSAIFEKTILANGATNSQTLMPNTVADYGIAAVSALFSGSVDMTVDSYINLNINGNAADTLGYKGILAWWIEN